jgi:hypothetical protein
LEAIVIRRCLPAANAIFAALFRVFALDDFLGWENENDAEITAEVFPVSSAHSFLQSTASTDASCESEASTADNALITPSDGGDLTEKAKDLEGKSVYSNL